MITLGLAKVIYELLQSEWFYKVVCVHFFCSSYLSQSRNHWCLFFSCNQTLVFKL